MYRVPAIAVLLAAAALPQSLEGQMRVPRRLTVPAGINTGPHVGAVQPSRGRLPIMVRRVARPAFFVQTRPFHRHFRFNVFFGNSCFTNPFFDPFFCRRFLFSNRFPFAQPVVVPYPVYTAPYYQGAERTLSTEADGGSDLAREIGRLTDEVEQLRKEQTPRGQTQQAAPQPRRSSEESTDSIILVFRDGRRIEVHNYATVGQTLWIFTEQRALKIPFSDLDAEATKKVNAERGVEVPLP